MSKTITPWRRH